MPRTQLTEATVRTAVLPGGKRQVIYWDTKTRGLGVLVGATTKTFIYQRDLPGGTTRRITLGRYPEITLTQARQSASRKHADMVEGIDPAAERRQRLAEQQRREWECFTLQAAMEHHLLGMRAKECSARSMDGLREELERNLKDWLTRPLATITPLECVTRHRDLTKRGPYMANRVLRMFRACYNSARRLYRELPECPTLAVVYNAQHRRREPVEDLAGWYKKVQSLTNPIRRDFQMFVMLTGLRGGDAVTVRFNEINWEEGTLLRPSPKGGVKRAFKIPLSAHVLAMLAKRQMENQIIYGQAEWVFPTRNTDNAVTHMQEPKEQRVAKGKKYSYLPTPHRLRDSFITACETTAAVDPITTKALVNHRLPTTDVTGGYVRPAMAHMRTCVERVNAVLLAGMGLTPSVAPIAKGA